MNRQTEYFSKLYNDETVLEPQVGPSLERIAKIDDIESPQIKETRTLHNLKNNRYPGENRTSADLHKHGGNELQTELYSVIQKAWQSEHVPQTWKEALEYPIPKKENSTNFENYRMIALLSNSK